MAGLTRSGDDARPFGSAGGVGAITTSPCLRGRGNKGQLPAHHRPADDQSKTLSEINEHLKQNGYFQKFPPEGIEVATRYIVMGIGQALTLRVPVERLREVNRAVEDTAWGGYRSEFYPTYDCKAIALQQRESAK
jgi:hypothetical protein